MRSWTLSVLLPYVVVSLPIYIVATSAQSGLTKLVFAYAMLAAGIAGIREYMTRRGIAPGGLAPYRGDTGSLLWLTTVGYFLMIMAVRLPIYARVQQIWEKTPIIMLVFTSMLLWERRRPADFGVQARDWQRQVGIGFILFALAWSGVAFGFFVREIVYAGMPTAGLGSTANGVAFNLLMYGYGNFAEELFFRGYVQTKFRRRFGPGVAILLQAVLFAIYHVNYRIFPEFNLSGLILYLWFTFTFGIVMGIIAERTRGLIAPTIVHVGYNTTWPGGLLYLGYLSARPIADTMLSAALPWLAFLLFTAPLTILALNRFGYRPRPGAGAGEAETATTPAV